MTKLLIESDKGRPIHDFGFAIVKAAEFENWFQNEKVYSVALSSVPRARDGYIPVGSIEFVLKYLTILGYDTSKYKPLNIPRFLAGYVKREIYYTDSLSGYNGSFFVKSADIIKDEKNDFMNLPVEKTGNFIITKEVEMLSEWRCFVHNNKLAGIRNYMGDDFLVPDKQYIENIIHDCNFDFDYTVDVCVTDQGTDLVELHHFFSCGLYGFNDKVLLPMITKTFHWLKKNLPMTKDFSLKQ
jgi:hypothetical protein